MSVGARPPQRKAPEWRHSARYLLIALVLHGLILLYPLALNIDPLATTPPGAVQVKLTEPVATIQSAPPPTAPKPQPAPAPHHEKPASTVPPVLAMASQPSSAPATFAVPAAPVTPTAAAAINAAPTPITAPRFDAAYLHNPLPEYPPVSRRTGEEGKVLLKVRVMPNGLPASIEIEQTSTFERLDNAARQVVARWRFVPAKRGDEAIEASVIVPIVFRLDN